MVSDQPVRIFVSYAHKDAAWRDALFEQSITTPSGIHPAWTDDAIQPGSNWNEEIERALQQATVAVLLVSRHFLDSQYIQRKELPVVLKDRVSRGLQLLWIQIGKIKTIEQTPFAGIQATHSLDRPLPARPDGNLKIVEGVRYQLQAALDPIGVPLMRDLNERYETFSLIGRGSTSVVYKSRDRILQRLVVIKALIHPEQLARFAQSARDAAIIADEPNFVKLYEAVLTARQPYCVMQYIEGQSLRGWIESDGRRPLAVVIKILSKVTRALVAAHTLKAAYGNLRPSNIVLAKNDEPFILPMGRRVQDCRGSKVLDELERRSPDAEEIAYLAPEQFDSTSETVSSELSDQYMLGLLAFELMTGELPPAISNRRPSQASLADIRKLGGAAFSELPLVSKLRPDCSEPMAQIVRRMTSRWPGDRYESLRELLVEIRRQENVFLATARDSYNRCKKEQDATGKSFFAAVYNTFFGRAKGAKSYFKIEELPFLYEKLDQAVIALFTFYEQERGPEINEPNVLTRIAQEHDHNHRGITPDFYKPFGESLIDTACGGGSPDDAFIFDPACRTSDGRQRIRPAWQEVLRPGAHYMASKYC